MQEVWLRISRSDLAQVENLSGWMTTVTGRVCLDLLRSRRARREEGFEGRPQETWALDRYAPDPEAEALLGESVGLALLTVLEKLTPPERVAFVLHDMFGAPSRRSPPSSVEVLRRPGSWPAGRAAGSGAAPLGPVQIWPTSVSWWWHFAMQRVRGTWTGSSSCWIRRLLSGATPPRWSWGHRTCGAHQRSPPSSRGVLEAHSWPRWVGRLAWSGPRVATARWPSSSRSAEERSGRSISSLIRSIWRSSRWRSWPPDQDSAPHPGSAAGTATDSQRVRPSALRTVPSCFRTDSGNRHARLLGLATMGRSLGALRLPFPLSSDEPGSRRGLVPKSKSMRPTGGPEPHGCSSTGSCSARVQGDPPPGHMPGSPEGAGLSTPEVGKKRISRFPTGEPKSLNF